MLHVCYECFVNICQFFSLLMLHVCCECFIFFINYQFLPLLNLCVCYECFVNVGRFDIKQGYLFKIDVNPVLYSLQNSF